METITPSTTRPRAFLARPLLVAVVCLEAFHFCVLLAVPHPTFLSNVMQLLLPLIATAVSLHQRRCANNLLGRRCWTAVATAFGIWSTAQVLYLYLLHAPAFVHWTVRPDDALWLLFGFPLLLAITFSTDEVDRVTWLDRAQAFLFFLVLYLLVFLPSGRLAMTHAYLIQNGALLLCCLLRLPVCRHARERRFFTRLTLFFLAYGPLEACGEFLYRHNWQAGSIVDLVWTLPIALFVALILRDELRSDSEDRQASSLVGVVVRMQGMSVAAMAFLSIGLAAVLATRQQWLGGALLICSFALFALRTNAREGAWHKAHRSLEENLLQDALTGLGNRTLLRAQLTEQLLTNPANLVLFFVDLDRFKSVNDSFGHALGDRLLIDVSQRLSTAAPPNATVCRLGGDEFVVLSAARDPEEAKRAGEQLAEALHAPFLLAGQELRCSASIGVVLSGSGDDADDLLRTADHAMYRAKQLGRNRVQLFDAALRKEMNSRWKMEAELRACIEADGIQIAFQPIFCLEQRRISGFEALARWHHPVLGNVPPCDFITLAEESGLILTLGAQILEKACRQMVTWNQTWKTNYSVSVNVSPRQFTDTELIPSLLATLDRTGLSPSLLRLEITETALLLHENVVKDTLEQARAHGIRISLDDFGTGYSSLSFLLSLPADEVKVDRSFVSHMHRDPQRKEVVRTVIHLGHSLGKRVVAEGVETEQDLLSLAEMGCECVQGYLISKPLAAEAMEADLPSIAARFVRHAPSNAAGTPDRSFAVSTPRLLPPRNVEEFDRQVCV